MELFLFFILSNYRSLKLDEQQSKELDYQFAQQN